MSKQNSHAIPVTMQETQQRSTLASPARPAARWLPELLEILDQHRVQVMRTALAIIVLGALVAIASPGTLAPNLLVGLMVGLAAVSIGAASAFVLDALNKDVLGPRDVRAAGGELLMPADDADRTASSLVAHLEATVLSETSVHFGVVTHQRGQALGTRLANQVATGLAALGNRVIVTDLRRPSEGAGVAEVVFGRVDLVDAVSFDDGLTLARVGAGPVLAEACRAYPSFLRKLPDDIDVSIALLPYRADAVADVEGIDHLLVPVQRGATRRAELAEIIETFKPSGVDTHVLLIEPASTTGLRAPATPPATPATPAPLAPLQATPEQVDALAQSRAATDAVGPQLAPLSSSVAPVATEAATAEPAATEPAATAPFVATVGIDVDHDLHVESGGDSDSDLDPDLIAEALMTGGFDDLVVDDPDATRPTPRIDVNAPPRVVAHDDLQAPAVGDRERAEAIGGAAESEDDALAMTAALHSFAAERMRDQDESS